MACTEKNQVNGITVKPLRETRWECRIECVKAIRCAIMGIREALHELAEMPSSDPEVRHKADILVNTNRRLRFSCDDKCLV